LLESNVRAKVGWHGLHRFISLRGAFRVRGNHETASRVFIREFRQIMVTPRNDCGVSHATQTLVIEKFDLSLAPASKMARQ